MGEPTNDVPKMGYMYIYDRLSEEPLALPNISEEQDASANHELFHMVPINHCNK